jgi:hypothetical protein
MIAGSVEPMRLKPELTAGQAYEGLSVMATMTWGLMEAALLETHLRSISEIMAVIGNIDLPEETEPLFGEDIALDPEILA